MLGCNSKNMDLRLNSLEVLTVLLSQTEVWLQVEPNMNKLLDCFCQIANDNGSNSEYAEPLIQGMQNIFKNQKELAKKCLRIIPNLKKENLMKLVTL